MKPMTRKESQAQTRERLLERGMLEVSQKGIHALSIRGLCEAEGLTAGAFYSNFESRTAYLGELSRAVISEFRASIRTANRKACRGTAEEAVAAFSEWSLEVEDRIALSMLELGALARSDAGFRALYIPQAGQFRSFLAGEMRTLFGTFGLRPQISYEQMAAGFMTMWMGQLMFRYMPDSEQFTRAIALFLSDLFRAARPEGAAK